MQTREKFIKNALSEFLRCHSAEAFVSAIDEIVLSYMISILKELDSNSMDFDAFDVDQFTEMMEAYLPGFQDFNSIEVSEWMFQIASQLRNLHVNDDIDVASSSSLIPGSSSSSSSSSLSLNDNQMSRSAPLVHTDAWFNERVKNTSTVNEAVAAAAAASGPKRLCNSSSLSSTTTTFNRSFSSPMENDFEGRRRLEMLIELFPSSTVTELIHCLELSAGDVEDAALWVLHHQERKEEEEEEGPQNKKKGIPIFSNDHQMKKSIVAKYSYVDTDEDKKQHRPIVPKSEPKKLVRYLEGKVVSIKGERFTEIEKKEEDNSKPSKQFPSRFH